MEELEIEEPKMSTNKKIFVVVKGLGMVVGGLACAAAAGAAMKGIIPMSNLSKYNKAMVGLGVMIFGGVAADVGGEYVANAFKVVEAAYEEGVKKFEEAKKKLEDQELEENEIVPV